MAFKKVLRQICGGGSWRGPGFAPKGASHFCPSDKSNQKRVASAAGHPFHGVGGSGGGDFRSMWLPVRPCYAPCPVPASTDYWTNPTLGHWQPANHRVGGTPSAALRAGPNVVAPTTAFWLALLARHHWRRRGASAAMHSVPGHLTCDTECAQRSRRRPTDNLISRLPID
ncbi:hypothetical protein D9M68_607830 [compost metagenome]